jgi:hypothetical protein
VRRQATVKSGVLRIKPDGLCHSPGVSPCTGAAAPGRVGAERVKPTFVLSI